MSILKAAPVPDTIREFATRAGVTPPDLWNFRDLAGLVGQYRVLTSLIRTPEDLARLIQEFVEDEVADGVLYDVCPSSNVRLGIVPSLDQHPVRAMLESGVAVTINADDPLFFRTSASEEIARLRSAFSLSDTEVANLACAGLDAAGASLTTRSKIRMAVTRWLSDNFETTAFRPGKDI